MSSEFQSEVMIEGGLPVMAGTEPAVSPPEVPAEGVMEAVEVAAAGELSVRATVVETVRIPASADELEPADPHALFLSLPEPQREALCAIARGKSHGAAAFAAKVTRMTLYRWRTHDEHFRQCYHYIIRQNEAEFKDHQRMLVGRANGVVARALEKDDVRAAFFVLKNLKRDERS